MMCSNGYPCFGSVDLCRPKPADLAHWLRVAGFDARHARALAARYHADDYRPRGDQIGYQPDLNIHVWKYYLGDVRYFRVCWWQHYPEPEPKARKTKAGGSPS
jgi:hypothetical protein